MVTTVLNCGRSSVSDMNSNAKKISAIAKVEGEDEPWQIKCDLDYRDGKPYAVLFWPTASNPSSLRVVPLDQTLLFPSSQEGVDFDYIGHPIPIPKDLAQMNPAGLSADGFRLGFFRIG